MVALHLILSTSLFAVDTVFWAQPQQHQPREIIFPCLLPMQGTTHHSKSLFLERIFPGIPCYPQALSGGAAFRAVTSQLVSPAPEQNSVILLAKTHGGFFSPVFKLIQAPGVALLSFVTPDSPPSLVSSTNYFPHAAGLGNTARVKRPFKCHPWRVYSW